MRNMMCNLYYVWFELNVSVRMCYYDNVWLKLCVIAITCDWN